MRIKQEYTHLLLKNPEEMEKENNCDRKKVFKITFKTSQKVRSFRSMYCSAYTVHTLLGKIIIPFLKIK